jgi:hypothetical protein
MTRLRPCPRVRVIARVVGVCGLLGMALAATPAGAASDPTDSRPAGQHSLSQLSPGLEILGGSVTGNGPQAGRSLDSSQATAFVQAWLPDSVFGSPAFQDPPTTLPEYQVEVSYRYQGTLGSMTVNYVSDGTSAWVSMPPQTLWPGVVVTQQRWIVAPDRTIAGFEGRLTPESVPTAHESAAPAASGGSTSTPELIVIAGLVVLAAAICILLIRRRDSRSKQARTT